MPIKQKVKRVVTFITSAGNEHNDMDVAAAEEQTDKLFEFFNTQKNLTQNDAQLLSHNIVDHWEAIRGIMAEADQLAPFEDPSNA